MNSRPRPGRDRMARSRRSGLVLALLIAAAAGASASQRGLAQYAYSPGKGKGKGALPVPLSVVSTAAYVQPALLTQNQQPVYRPAAVLPTDQIKDTFIQVKDKVASVGASVHNFMTMKKAPAAAAAPAVYAAPLAGPMAPIFASGQALPVVQPYQFVPVRRGQR
ncbi:MAG: hypothetical protein J3K34DRAFT_241201 [Monoraphidium minutum]|nr:MAG: hypothetical protein J3K34DRAFT_241201 [Monoraphidium minutum]